MNPNDIGSNLYRQSLVILYHDELWGEGSAVKPSRDADGASVRVGSAKEASEAILGASSVGDPSPVAVAEEARAAPRSDSLAVADAGGASDATREADRGSSEDPKADIVAASGGAPNAVGEASARSVGGNASCPAGNAKPEAAAADEEDLT